MEQLLQDYGRYLLLEGQLPALEREKEYARRESLAAQRELSQKRLEWERLENPSLFQRMMGKLPEKQETAHREFREAEQKYSKANRRAEEAAVRVAETKTALKEYVDLPQRYAAVKSPETSHLAVRYFAPAARCHIEIILEALEKAIPQLRTEAARPRMPDEENDMLVHYGVARSAAEKLNIILAQFPAEENWCNDYLRNPDGFLLAAATKYSRLDRLNAAIGQMRTLRERLQSN